MRANASHSGGGESTYRSRLFKLKELKNGKKRPQLQKEEKKKKQGSATTRVEKGGKRFLWPTGGIAKKIRRVGGRGTLSMQTKKKLEVGGQRLKTHN